MVRVEIDDFLWLNIYSNGHYGKKYGRKDQKIYILA